MELGTSFSVKEGVKSEKRGFQSMKKKLGEKFRVVFSFSVVVTGTELLKKNRGIKTHIHWVPGHVQVAGNEKAEKLEKEGREGNRLPRDASTSITHLKRKNKEHQMEEWKKRWLGMRRGHSYQGRPAPNIYTQHQNHPSRKLVMTIVQMHNRYGYNRNYL